MDLPDPGIEPGSPALQADSLPLAPTGIMKKSKSNVKDAGQGVETHEGAYQE